MQAVGLIEEMGHAMRLNSEVAPLVCDRRIGHAVNGAVRGHDEARLLSVLPRHVAKDPISLDDTRARGGGGTVEEVVEKPLSVLPRAQHAHLRSVSDLSWQVKFSRDEWLGFIDHHCLATRSHDTLTFPRHGFSHVRLLVRPGDDWDVRPHTAPTEKPLHDPTVVYVRKNI